jgi:transcriptional regulator with XRE-family HTH domain
MVAPLPANTEPDPALGAAVRRLRHDADLRQEDLAHRAGIHYTTLRKIEAGKADLTLTTLRRLAAALEVKVSELLQLAEELRDEAS